MQMLIIELMKLLSHNFNDVIIFDSKFHWLQVWRIEIDCQAILLKLLPQNG